MRALLIATTTFMTAALAALPARADWSINDTSRVGFVSIKIMSLARTTRFSVYPAVFQRQVL